MGETKVPLIGLLLVLIAGCAPLAALSEPSTPPITATTRGTGPKEPVITPGATPEPISKAAATPTSATKEATVTPDIAATVVPSRQPDVLGSYLAPDGKWRAEVVGYACILTDAPDQNAYEQLRLILVASGDHWTADSQLQHCGGLGAFGLEGLFWSPNSRYFYYTRAREGVPDGCGYWERPIVRLDTTSLKKQELGGGPPSPDMGKLAAWQGRELVVWDTNDGEIGRVPALAADAWPGPIAWSPDGRALAYVQFASSCPLSGKSYVVRVDVPELKQTLMLASETPTFGSAKWENPDQLRLSDEKRKAWQYDLRTQELAVMP